MVKNIFKDITLLAFASLLISCAGAPEPKPIQTASGKWFSRPIKADGSKKEWPRSAPQYKNSDTGTKIWIRNNAEQICLLAEVKDPGMVRQLIQNGLTLSVKTNEKDAKPFSIRLKGHTSFRPRNRPEHGPDKEAVKNHKPAKPSAMADGSSPDPMPLAKLPGTLVVTYPFSSGPVTMSMKEARTTGIALGLADAGRHTMVFEAVISLDAIFFNLPRIPGPQIEINLSANAKPFTMARRKNPGENKNERPKEKPPKEKEPGHKVKQAKAPDETFQATVEITLAGPPK